MKAKEIFDSEYNSIKLQVEKIVVLGIDESLQADVLRAAIVFIVSAFDRFVHDFVVDRFMNILIDKSQIPQRANQLKVGFNLLCLLHQDGSTPEYDKVEVELRKTLSWQSYQHPNKVSGILSALFDVDIWHKVSSIIGSPANDIKNQLELIVDRRDKIAHESDIRPESVSVDIEKYPINIEMVQNTLSYMSNLVNAINTLS